MTAEDINKELLESLYGGSSPYPTIYRKEYVDKDGCDREFSVVREPSGKLWFFLYGFKNGAYMDGTRANVSVAEALRAIHDNGVKPPDDILKEMEVAMVVEGVAGPEYDPADYLRMRLKEDGLMRVIQPPIRVKHPEEEREP